jgi:diguanylate cyclase (GGDEF)-like protein
MHVSRAMNLVIDNLHEPTSTQLLAIIEIQTEIAKLGLDLGGVMNYVAERAQQITHAQGAVVELVEGEEMVYRAVAGTASGMLGVRLRRETSLSGLCVAQATALRSDDSETDPRVDREACRRVGVRSMVVVPLIHLGSAVGALKVFWATPEGFSAGDITVLGVLSDLIAAAMFHATKFGADELFRQATTDSLTGLANRALFLDRLRNAVVRAKRAGARVGVLVLDMDGLKPINDRYGHRAGDAAIKEFAARIAAAARQSDTVARFGGDEFAVLLSEVTSREQAGMARDRINSRCDGPFLFEGRLLEIGASVGLAVSPDDGNEPESLLEHADQAMYSVKRLRKTA